MAEQPRQRLLAGLALLVLAALRCRAVSGVAPYDRATWLLKVAPAPGGLRAIAKLRHQPPQMQPGRRRNAAQHGF